LIRMVETSPRRQSHHRNRPLSRNIHDTLIYTLETITPRLHIWYFRTQTALPNLQKSSRQSDILRPRPLAGHFPIGQGDQISGLAFLFQCIIIRFF
jgi:hypothetical protein